MSFIASLLLATSLALTPSGAEHGFAGSIGCDGLACVGETIECALSFSHNDDFGDTTEVTEAFAIIEAQGGDVRLPPEGHLEIVEVYGNTTAVVGGDLPVRLGPGGSTHSGLPGLPDPGRVTFRVTGYEVQPADPENLRLFGRAVWVDLCDDANTQGCTFDLNDFVVVARISTSCHGDIDRDCEIGFGDVLAILAAWGNSGGAEDVDGDGTVGFGDVLRVLATWGPCS